MLAEMLAKWERNKKWVVEKDDDEYLLKVWHQLEHSGSRER